MQADPATGVIVTKYLASNGDVQTQMPSTAALAYLRMGLSETGAPKPKVAGENAVVA